MNAVNSARAYGDLLARVAQRQHVVEPEQPIVHARQQQREADPSVPGSRGSSQRPRVPARARRRDRRRTPRRRRRRARAAALATRTFRRTSTSSGQGTRPSARSTSCARAVAGLRAMLPVVHDRAHAGDRGVARRFLLVLAAKAKYRQARELLELGARRDVRGPRDVDREVLPMELEARVVAQADQADAIARARASPSGQRLTTNGAVSAPRE